jgi:uncharacterized protein YndB with AHSA1/START domain
MTEPKAAEEKKEEVRVEREIELAAPIDEVWKALTDPQELARWFPLEARVTPGVGGKIFLSWGPGCEGESEIVTWEPSRRLAGKNPFSFVEWTLESRGGKTVLRLVQSSFLSGADWEQEWYDSTSYGWNFMLLGLKVALERHRGVARQVAWPRLKVAVSREEAYRKLLNSGALFSQDLRAALHPGETYSVATPAGERYRGRVEFLRENRGFCLSVRELNDALLWLTIEGVAGSIEVQVWLSAFGLEPARVASFNENWQRRLREIFGS